MNSDLTSRQLEQLQAALRERRSALLDQIEQQLGGASRSEHAREVLLQDGDDAPARDADREVDLARSDQEVVELHAVDEALARLAAGSYGRCADCDEAIAFDRLLRQPAAQRCVACQSAHEQRTGQGAQRATL